jgi:hypothetical protein
VRQSRYILGIGVALILGSIALFVINFGVASHAVLLLALAGAVLVAFARYQSRTGLLVAIHNATFALSSRGAFAEALALSARIPASLLVRGANARAVYLQRGMLHFFDGNRDQAEVALTRALGVPGSWFDPVSGGGRTLAIGSRALVRAAARNDAGAIDDVRHLCDEADACPEAEARAALAETLVASREEGAGGELAARLRALDPYLPYLMPYERALARGLRKASRRNVRSIYREHAADLEKEQRNGIAAWLRDISPEAAAGVASEAATHVEGTIGAAPSATAEAIAASRARWKAGPTASMAKSVKVFGVLGLLLGAFLMIWQSLAPSAHPQARARPPEVAADDDGQDATFLVAVFGAPLFGFLSLAFAVWHVRGLNADLRRARKLAARGETAEAERILLRLLKSSMASGGATHQLAALAEQRGDFATAIARTTAGLAHTMATRGRRITAHDLLAPALLGEQAFCRAAAGHPDEAAADLAVLETDYPSYAWIEGERFRARLAILLARGDHEGARSFATTRSPTANVPIRVELLCDVLLAIANPALAQEERSALRHELEADPTYAPWIDALVPGLLASFFSLCAEPA